MAIDAGARDRYTMYIWAFDIIAVGVWAFVATVRDINLKVISPLIQDCQTIIPSSPHTDEASRSYDHSHLA